MEAFVGLIGDIIGTSLSPEMWIAVVAVVMLGRTRARYWIALGIAVVALTILRAVLIPGFTPKYAFPGAVALLLWSAIGVGLRSQIARFRRKTRSGI